MIYRTVEAPLKMGFNFIDVPVGSYLMAVSFEPPKVALPNGSMAHGGEIGAVICASSSDHVETMGVYVGPVDQPFDIPDDQQISNKPFRVQVPGGMLVAVEFRKATGVQG